MGDPIVRHGLHHRLGNIDRLAILEHNAVRLAVVRRKMSSLRQRSITDSSFDSAGTGGIFYCAVGAQDDRASPAYRGKVERVQEGT